MGSLNRLQYITNGDKTGIIISGLFSMDPIIEIPDHIDNLPVVEISSGAFRYNYYMQEIKLPSTLKLIGNDAFAYSGLVKVTIPNSVTYIGNKAFAFCSHLKEIVFSDNIVSIGESAFQNCTELVSITLPKNLEDLKKEAFDGCTALKEVKFGEKLTFIGASAFSACKALEEIHIPNSVLKIEEYAFFDCSSLRKVIIPDNFYDITENCFTNCPAIKFSEFDNGLYLGSDKNPYMVLLKAKSNSISSIKLHEDTKAIADSALFNSTSLKTVTVNDGLVSIGKEAFYGSSIEAIYLPDSLKVIKESAFDWCTSLSETNLPKCIKPTDLYPFLNVKKLYLTYDGTEEEFVNKFESHWLGSLNSTHTIVCCKDGKIFYKSILDD